MSNNEMKLYGSELNSFPTSEIISLHLLNWFEQMPWTLTHRLPLRDVLVLPGIGWNICYVQHMIWYEGLKSLILRLTVLSPWVFVACSEYAPSFQPNSQHSGCVWVLVFPLHEQKHSNSRDPPQLVSICLIRMDTYWSGGHETVGLSPWIVVDFRIEKLVGGATRLRSLVPVLWMLNKAF